MSAIINWQQKIIQIYGNREIFVDISSLITRFKIPSDTVIEFMTSSENILKFGGFTFKKS